MSSSTSSCWEPEAGGAGGSGVSSSGSGGASGAASSCSAAGSSSGSSSSKGSSAAGALVLLVVEVDEDGFLGGRGAGLVRQRRLERLVELVGEPLLAEELVEFVGRLVLGGGGLGGRVGADAGLDPGQRVDRGEARLGQLGVDELLVGGSVGLGGGVLELGLDVEHFGRLVGDRVALLGRVAGVGDRLVLHRRVLLLGGPSSGASAWAGSGAWRGSGASCRSAMLGARRSPGSSSGCSPAPTSGATRNSVGASAKGSGSSGRCGGPKASSSSLLTSASSAPWARFSSRCSRIASSRMLMAIP